jgi:hypothetical protein
MNHKEALASEDGKNYWRKFLTSFSWFIRDGELSNFGTN